MTKIKDLKEKHPEFNITILDLLRILDPSKTGKYMNIILNTIKNSHIYGRTRSRHSNEELNALRINNEYDD